MNRVMDVTSLASTILGVKSAQQAVSIQYAVAAKMLDTQRAQGNAATQLIDAAGRQIQTATESLATETAQLLDVLA